MILRTSMFPGCSAVGREAPRRRGGWQSVQMCSQQDTAGSVPCYQESADNDIPQFRGG